MNKNDILIEVFSELKNQILENDNPNQQVIDYKEPNQLKEIFKNNFENGSDDDNLLKNIKNYIKYSVKTSAKQFHNQLFAGTNLPSLLGELTSVVMNASNYTYEVSPIGTLMETELLEKMAKKVGYEKSSGTFLTGGSNGNLVALLCARQKYFKQVKIEGLYNLPKLTLFANEKSHYSFEKAANISGLGIDSVIYIKSDNQGEMICEDLELKIKESINRGEKPFFVAATVCTTEYGSFDPIKEINSICKKYDLWFHIDGAWGGSILLSDKYKSLLSGSELSDSFVWDPHKMMNIPLICSVFLTKHKGLLEETVSTNRADYIFHEHELMEYDLGRFSLQCGRRVDAFKLWLAWNYYGDKGWNEIINKQFEIAEEVTNYIKSQEDLELVVEPRSININFRTKSKLDVDLDKFNLAIREKMRLDGSSLCNYTKINNKLVFRLIINNPEKSFEDYKIFFLNLRNAKNEIEKSLKINAK